MSDEEREKTPAYISRCRGCNQVIGASVDNGEHLEDLAHFLFDEVTAGSIIERTTVGDARNMFGQCKCKETTP